MIKQLTEPFLRFIRSQQFSGVLLIGMTMISLVLANSSFSESYHHLWQTPIIDLRDHLSLNLEETINEVLMSVFFLLVGLEIKREFMKGELSGRERALLPLAAAAGGMIVPAIIYAFLNKGTTTASGWGIPMATDIAFAIGVMSLLGNRIPDGLKVLLTALAVVDDLGAVIVIALFYTQTLAFLYLALALMIVLLLLLMNRKGITSLWLYLLPGIVLWYCIYHSGVHSTIAGVLLALIIPLTGKENCPLHRLENTLHGPVNYGIMPLFALANTAIHLGSGSFSGLLSTEGLGIAAGLIIGKPTGIALFIWLMLKLKWSALPSHVNMKEVVAMGFLGGIGFTMSIFISLLAFQSEEHILTAKLSILISSVIAGTIGFLLLKRYADSVN